MAEYIYEETTDFDGVTCYIKRGVIVRCKDCNHVFVCNCLSCREGVSVYCGKYGKHMTKNDFCSYGERREENADD